MDKLYYYEDSDVYTLDKKQLDCTNAVRYLRSMSDTNQTMTYVTKDSREIKLKIITNEDNSCRSCYFTESNLERLGIYSIQCPAYCTGLNYIEATKSEDFMDKATDMSFVTMTHAKRKLCNPDVCIYHPDCDSASLCIIKLLFYE